MLIYGRVVRVISEEGSNTTTLIVKNDYGRNPVEVDNDLYEKAVIWRGGTLWEQEVEIEFTAETGKTRPKIRVFD